MGRVRCVSLVIALALLLTLLPSVVSAAPLAQEGQSYTVQKDDNLWTIAEKYLGNGTAYPAIVAATNAEREEDITFARVDDASLIQPGWKLFIPSAEEAEKYIALALPKRGGTFRAGLSSDTLGFDPHLHVNKTSVNYIELLYDSLFTFDPNMNIVPALATSYEQEGDLNWIFHLREGVKFHNGKDFTADDVKYSLERIKELSPKKALFEPIETVEVLDPYTVKLTLSKPFGPLLTYLALSSKAAIVDRETVEANGDLSQVENGTGAFKLVEWVLGSHVKMEANKDYFVEGLPRVDALQIEIVPDEKTATARLRAGELDWIELYSFAEVEALRKSEDLRVIAIPYIDWKYMFFNTTKPPFDDVRVRQAIAYGLDRQEIVDTALFGLGRPAVAGGTSPPGTWAYADYPLYETPDRDKAKKLLEEAGYADGFNTTIRFPANWPIYGDIAVPIQAQMKEMGIQVQLEPEDWGILTKELPTGQFEIFVSGWAGKVDPDEQLYEVFHTDGVLNYGRFSDPEVDSLLEKGRSTTDLAGRKAAYVEVQKRIMELAPEIFLLYPIAHYGVADYVEGFNPMPDGSYHSFAEVWLNR